MPSIISNAVLNPPRPAVKVELPALAKPAERSERATGFEQMLRDVRDKQASSAETAPKKGAASAADKSAKSAKPKRAARSERSRKGEKPEAGEEDEEVHATDEAAESAASATAASSSETDEAGQIIDAEKEKSAATTKEGEKKDSADLSERAAEQGGCAVQAAGDATQQRQSKHPQPKADDEIPADVVDADAAKVAAPVAVNTASPQDLAAQAAAAAAVSNQAAPTAHKPTVSAFGAAAPTAINPLGEGLDPQGAVQLQDLELVDPNSADASLPTDLDWPADFETKLKDAATAASKPQEKGGPETSPILDSASAPLAASHSKTESAQAAPVPREAQFTDDNHEKIVTSVRTQLMPAGGTMRIRLDPPELGALQVMVEMRNGTLSATFQTSNDDATQLLSHSLNQLKHMLETQGVSVDKLQVQQAPKSEGGQSKGDDQQNSQQQSAEEHAARQEQQRKQMLQRMWRRASGIADPIDFTA